MQLDYIKCMSDLMHGDVFGIGAWHLLIASSPIWIKLQQNVWDSSVRSQTRVEKQLMLFYIL